MSVYSLPPLIGSLLAISIGLFVIHKNPKSAINQAFAIFAISIFGWQFGYAIVYSLKNPQAAMLGTRIACAFATLTAPAFYHLVVSYLKLSKEKLFLILSYLISTGFFFGFIFTRYFIAEPYKFFWGHYSHAGPWHNFYLIIFFIIFGRGFYLLYKAYLNRKNYSHVEANRIAYLFIAYLIALLGAIDYIQKYNVEFYPFGWMFEIGFALITAYAITKHHLMDIDIVIRKTAIYSILTAILSGILLSIVFLASLLFHGIIGHSSIWAAILAIFIISIIFQPLRNKIQDFIDKMFFKKEYEYRVALKDLSQSWVSISDINQLTKSAAFRVKEVLKAKSAKIYLVDGGK